MKIVIIGEFSGFAKNLSKGFSKIGHEPFVFSWGDGYRDIEQDKASYLIRNTSFRDKGLLGYISTLYYSLSEARKLSAFVKSEFSKIKADAVIVINPIFIRRKGQFWNPLFSRKMILYMVKDPQMIFLSACGSDIPYYSYWMGKQWKNQELVQFNHNHYVRRKFIKHHYYIASFINKVIPTIYSYAEAWRKSEYAKSFSVMPTVMLPVDTSEMEPYNKINGKIVVFHGITRPEIKGTKYIIEAMKKLEEKYPDKVECHYKGGLPLKDYLELIKRTNISIDQALECGPGMNALFSLALGKVVMSGNTPEQQKEVGIFDNPIINIIPDSNQIFLELERFVLNPALIEEISRKSREYVVKYHDCKVIAEQYVKIFNSI